MADDPKKKKRDRLFLSKQEHEQEYLPKRKNLFKKYKKKIIKKWIKKSSKKQVTDLYYV